MADEENLDLEEGEEEEQAETKPKKKFSISPMIIKILMIIAALLVVILISGLIAYFVSKGVGKASGVQGGISDDMIKQPPPTYFPITPDFKQLAVELPERVYMIKDRIYALISSYTYDQLRTNEGREQLKADIKREINSMLRNGQIDDVLFVDLILS